MIAHFVTVHPRDDSRILSKEVATLARSLDEEVRLYVQDGLGDEFSTAYNCRIVDTGPRLKRIPRMTLGAWRMIRALLRDRPRVAHFHDPELLPWALLLRLRGIKVVYDVHEDVPRQVTRNPTLPGWAKVILPPLVSFTEWFAALFLNGIVTTAPAVTARFPRAKTVEVRNFPLLNELHKPNPTPMRDRPVEFAYVGSISEDRNIYGMIRAVAQLRHPTARFRLAGTFAVPEVHRRAEAMPEWSSVVRFEGWTNREGLADILADARAGLVILKPVEHEMHTLPIKLFEYMAAGIPVISSDFPLWRSFVDDAQCGLLVDPMNLNAVVEAMRWIIDHPDEAEAMGKRGRQAMVDRYCWNTEAETLLTFYRDQLGVSSAA